jgi:hypothetical protein
MKDNKGLMNSHSSIYAKQATGPWHSPHGLISLRKMKTLVYTKTHSRSVHNNFTPNCQKLLKKCLSTSECISKLWYIQIRNTTQSYKGTYKTDESQKLCAERSQSYKVTYWIVLSIWHCTKGKMIGTEHRSGMPGGEDWAKYTGTWEKLFYILTVVVVAWLYITVTIHRTTYLKRMTYCIEVTLQGLGVLSLLSHPNLLFRKLLGTCWNYSKKGRKRGDKGEWCRGEFN